MFQRRNLFWVTIDNTSFHEVQEWITRMTSYCFQDSCLWCSIVILESSFPYEGLFFLILFFCSRLTKVSWVWWSERKNRKRKEVRMKSPNDANMNNCTSPSPSPSEQRCSLQYFFLSLDFSASFRELIDESQQWQAHNWVTGRRTRFWLKSRQLG